MGRKPTTTNPAILAATARAIDRLGPARLTLADVAAEAGLAPATLLQRFGSKRALLLAFAEQSVTLVESELAAARAESASPLAALTRVLGQLTRGLDTPQALANNLAFLQIDLSDPDFHRPARDHAAAVRAGIAALLAEAQAAGELTGIDPPRLARAVQTTFNGSLVLWAIERTGSLADWLRDDLDVLLEPFRPVRAEAVSEPDLGAAARRRGAAGIAER